MGAKNRTVSKSASRSKTPVTKKVAADRSRSRTQSKAPRVAAPPKTKAAKQSIALDELLGTGPTSSKKAAPQKQQKATTKPKATATLAIDELMGVSGQKSRHIITPKVQLKPVAQKQISAAKVHGKSQSKAPKREQTPKKGSASKGKKAATSQQISLDELVGSVAPRKR